MSTEQSPAPLVSVARCQDWREQAANGTPYETIAQDTPWMVSTVRMHCQEYCRHWREREKNGEDGDTTPRPDDPDETTHITDLRDLAAELGRSPTSEEVTNSDREITEKTCARAFGAFQAALDAADLPSVSNRTPVDVRKTLYQRAVQETPELAGQEAEP